MGVYGWLLGLWESFKAGVEGELHELQYAADPEGTEYDRFSIKKGKKDEPEAKPDTNTPDTCKDGDKQYKEGDTWSDPDVCNLKVCHARGVISVRQCPEWQVKPPCRQEDLKRIGSFPDCCPSVVCSILQDPPPTQQ